MEVQERRRRPDRRSTEDRRQAERRCGERRCTAREGNDRRDRDRRRGLRRGSGRRLTDWSRADVHDCARDLEAKGTETILVVDDEELVRNLVKSLLESHGYKVLQAASGAAALDLISRYPHPLHLVLTDVVMPGMNGSELSDRLALLRPNLKILYMSANPRDILAQGNEPGSSPAYLQKPFTVKALLMRVRSLLEQSGPG